ncbi:MAG: hypothetical protein GY853_01065 [PVC group bacterium]|nr:hypothetical protein [PVC group bacterium]
MSEEYPKWESFCKDTGYTGYTGYSLYCRNEGIDEELIKREYEIWEKKNQ